MNKEDFESFLKVSDCVRQNFNLAKINWFRVGGKADYLYKANNIDQLKSLLENLPENYPLFILGVGSNVIIRDGGIEGVVLRLGKEFAQIKQINETDIEVGAAALDLSVAKFACENSLASCEFLSGIPGTIGAGIKMNAGSYGSQMQDILISCEAFDLKGKKYILSNKDMNFAYRSSNPKVENLIYTKAILRCIKGDKIKIQKTINEIQTQRNETQPIKSRTGGSTFKNPPNLKAWKLIDEVGMRGRKVNDAEMSDKHCNFMINNGNAKAADLENLGEIIRQKVKSEKNIDLEWEIIIKGRKDY